MGCAAFALNRINDIALCTHLLYMEYVVKALCRPSFSRKAFLLRKAYLLRFCGEKVTTS
jgi:hypothetical protein